jgi:sulfur carrier protein ThiS
MKLKITGKIEKSIELPKDSKVRDLLAELKISENDVLIVRKKKLLIAAIELKEGDSIELLDVVSGG